MHYLETTVLVPILYSALWYGKNNALKCAPHIKYCNRAFNFSRLQKPVVQTIHFLHDLAGKEKLKGSKLANPTVCIDWRQTQERDFWRCRHCTCASMTLMIWCTWHCLSKTVRLMFYIVYKWKLIRVSLVLLSTECFSVLPKHLSPSGGSWSPERTRQRQRGKREGRESLTHICVYTGHAY